MTQKKNMNNQSNIQAGQAAQTDQTKHNKNFPLSSLSDYRSEIYGASILWIMIFHAYLCGVVWPKPLEWINIGNMGVEIFLFLSGTGLYYSFSRDKDIPGFYKRRVLRIFIPILVICTPYWIWLYAQGEASLFDLVLKYTTLDFWVSGRQQIWFISLIMVCYVFYPFIYHILFGKEEDGCRKPWFRAIFMCLLLVCILGEVEKAFPLFYKAAEIGLTRIPVFILGCAMGKCVFDKKEISRGWIPVLLVLMIFTCWLILSGQVHGTLKRYTYIFGGIPITLLLGYIFYRFDLGPLKKVLRFFGKISLECYLTQIICIALYQFGLFWPYEEGSIVKYLLLMCLAVILAVIGSKVEKVLLCVLNFREQRSK